MRYLSRARMLLEQSVSELWRYKLRSFLTMFGIGWGICALALIMALGEGFRQGQRKNWRQLGDSIVMVFGGRTEMQAGGQRAGRMIRFYDEDVKLIREQCPAVAVVAGEVKNWDVSLESSANSGRFLVLGVDPEYLRIRNLPADTGRSVGWADVEQATRVCVLGDSVRKQLFEDEKDVVGQPVRINGYPYQVIGLMSAKDQNSSYDGWDNDKVLIPASSLRRDMPPFSAAAVEGRVQMLVYRPHSVEDWKTAQQQVRRALARRHGFDEHDEAATPMWDTIKTAAMFDDIFSSLGLFLGAVAVVTLTLGGMGVMNTMMTSVVQRTHEIGLKKALGATRARILLEFLLEGLVLAFVSGAGGIILIGTLAAIVNSFPMPAFFAGLPVDGSLVLRLTAALGAIAVASALPPAWRAARLTPVEALCYER
jgi:putative ABC transport system permease protein